MAACTSQPSTITGGIILTSAPYNDTEVAVYSCNSGYIMSGAPYVTCNAGTWSSTLPSCSLTTSNTMTSNETNSFYSEFPTWLVFTLATVLIVFGVLLLTCILVWCLQLFGCYRAGGLFGDPYCCYCCRGRRGNRYSDRYDDGKPKHCKQFPRRYEYDENGRRFHYDDLGRRCYYEHRNRAAITHVSPSSVSPDVESSVSEQKNSRITFANTVNEMMVEKKTQPAKELAIWKPHANPVRNINTSTK